MRDKEADCCMSKGNYIIKNQSIEGDANVRASEENVIQKRVRVAEMHSCHIADGPPRDCNPLQPEPQRGCAVHRIVDIFLLGIDRVPKSDVQKQR
jgi:hypothetical protein